MATGFKDIQVPSFDEDAGYETIFEKLKQEAGGENQSFLWYRNKIRSYALGLSAKPEAVITVSYTHLTLPTMLWV